MDPARLMSIPVLGGRAEHPAVCDRIEAAVRDRGREIAQG